MFNTWRWGVPRYETTTIMRLPARSRILGFPVVRNGGHHSSVTRQLANDAHTAGQQTTEWRAPQQRDKAIRQRRAHSRAANHRHVQRTSRSKSLINERVANGSHRAANPASDIPTAATRPRKAHTRTQTSLAANNCRPQHHQWSHVHASRSRSNAGSAPAVTASARASTPGSPNPL